MRLSRTMVNLERLKGSGLLIQGFAELLETWYEDESPNEKPFPEHPIYERLPREVESFHRIIHQWPQLKNRASRVFDRLYIPPCVRTYYNESTNDWIVKNDQLVLAYENQRDWEIWLSTAPEMADRLFCNYWGSELEMKTPLDEFLVTFAFDQWISESDWSNLDSPTESTLVYSGRYAGDRLIKFYNPSLSASQPVIYSYS